MVKPNAERVTCVAKGLREKIGLLLQNSLETFTYINFLIFICVTNMIYDSITKRFSHQLLNIRPL